MEVKMARWKESVCGCQVSNSIQGMEWEWGVFPRSLQWVKDVAGSFGQVFPWTWDILFGGGYLWSHIFLLKIIVSIREKDMEEEDAL